HEVGNIDGIMGSRTRGALLAFKADWNDANAGTKNDLPLDDKLDEATLAALMTGLPRVVSPERETAPESAIEDHAAITDAKKTGLVGKVAVGAGALGALVDTEVVDKVGDLVGVGGKIKALVVETLAVVGPFWPVLVIVAGVAIVL